MSGWAAFWIFVAVFYAVDSWVFTKGYETFFHRHKTVEEKALQKKIIRERTE